MSDDLQARNRATVKRLLVAVVLMFGFAFALVPLYDVICDVTGLNGKTSSTAATAAPDAVDEERTVRVSFITRRSGMDGGFRSEERSVRVHPGEIRMVNFYARNDKGEQVVTQAIPSVTPGEAAPHLKKTQCFCFNQQTLAAGEEKEMPMIFYLDPALPEHIEELTLSYTLYDISERVQEQNKDVAALPADDNRI